MTITAVRPEKILKELGKLWVDLGKQEQNGVLRACAMTLIVVVDETHDAADVGELIASLMHEHPSRAIVLRVRASHEPLLEARVFAQCWMPFGRRQQICCEQIEIIASARSLSDVPAVMRGLVVPDLPVILYCPSENLWWSASFQSLLPLATKLILDSTGMADSTRVLAYLDELRQPLARADLTYSRLTPWREAVAQVFDDPRCLRRVYDLQEVRILHTAGEEPSAVYYMAGWFMHALGAGVHIKIAPGVRPQYASIAQIELIGEGFAAALELVGDLSLDLRVAGEYQKLAVLPPLSSGGALRQELSVLGRDRLFEDVLGLANLMRGGQ